MSETVQIGVESHDHIEIKVVSRLYPQETDYWDGNWLNSEVTVCQTGVRTKVQANLRSNEFSSFLQQLEAITKGGRGRAEFEAMEECLVFRIDDHGEGSFVAQGSFRSSARGGIKVDFSISLGHAELVSIMRQLRAVLDKFPVLGKPL